MGLIVMQVISRSSEDQSFDELSHVHSAVRTLRYALRLSEL
jgi:hypothetical protein